MSDQVSGSDLITSFASMATGASGDVALERRFLGVLERAYRLWCGRHRKYGRGNIARHGAVGCLVRMSDKIARLDHFYIDGVKESFIDESLADSWLDALNYAAMGLMCHEQRWNLEGEKLNATGPITDIGR